MCPRSGCPCDRAGTKTQIFTPRMLLLSHKLLSGIKSVLNNISLPFFGPICTLKIFPLAAVCSSVKLQYTFPVRAKRCCFLQHKSKDGQLFIKKLFR